MEWLKSLQSVDLAALVARWRKDFAGLERNDPDTRRA